MIIGDTSKDTKKAVATIDDIQNVKAEHINQTADDEKIVGFIKKRKTEMAVKRTVLDKSWQQYMKQYEAIYVPYTDGRAASNVPLERAIIDLFVAEASKRRTEYNFNGGVDFSWEEQVLEKVWKDDWSVNNRNNELIDNEYLTAIFGTSIIYTGYERQYRIISDFAGENEETGKAEWQRKLETKSKILLNNIDIRNFRIDEKAKNIDEAVDCIYESYISYEEFTNLRLDPNYDSGKLNAVVPNTSEYDNYRPFIVREEKGEGEAKKVKITRYWNVKLDMYYEMANDNILILNHPILNASHRIPFVIRQYEKNLFSIYGAGLCQLLETFKSDINTLREMLMEAIKKSNQETIAIGSNLTFDGNKFAFNNQFLKFKGNLDGNFKQLTGTPPNQAIFTRLQDLFKEIAIFTGIDIMNILGEAQQTAYQTAVQKESSLSRVNVILENRDQAFERLADLHKDNLQMFYAMKIVRELQDIDEKGNIMDKMDDEGNSLGKPESTYPTIEVPKMKGKKFLDTNEKVKLEITPEMIRGKIKIDVSTNLNTPTIVEVEKAQKMEFFNGLGLLSKTYADDPELEKIIPKKKAVLDLAKLNNIETQQTSDGEVSEEKGKMYEELKTAMTGIRTPAQAPNQDANLADIDPMGQPEEVNSIKTPNI